MEAVSVIDIEENFRTFRLTSLAQYGCSNELLQKLKYVSQRVLPYMVDGDDTLKVADA
jgi:polo-like kinase 1